MHLKTIPMNDHLRIECLTLACAALDIVGPEFLWPVACQSSRSKTTLSAR